MSLPRIIKTVFYVEKDRLYHFDVNQNISIADIKQMLLVASKVAKIGLRIFLKENGAEYTQYKEETLEELFPDRSEIEFTIKIDRRFRVNQDYDQLKLGEYCVHHKHKYCYYYCFDCEESLCSMCLSEGKHERHSLFEKFDYLKPSSVIVENAFADIDSLVSLVDNLNITDIEQLKLRLKSTYFPTLIDILKKIELKMIEQIDTFNKHFYYNVNILKKNKNNLKDHCTEGLDELKSKIEIDKILKDEGVFLHFDHKVKELENEKQKIYEDNVKLERIISSFSYAKLKLENTYEEIKKFLNSQLNSTIYEDMRRHTTEINIEEVQKDEIFKKLLSEFRVSLGGGNHQHLHQQFIKQEAPPIITNFNQKIHDSSNISNMVNENNITDRNEQNDKRLSGSHSQSSGTKDRTVGSLSESFDLSNNLINKANEIFEGLKESKEKEGTVYYANVTPNTNKVILVTHSLGEGEKVDDERAVSLNHNIIGVNFFYPNSAIVNTGKATYISGGFDSRESKSLFIKYLPESNSIIRLADLPTPKHSHSLFYTKDFIYSIGGYRTNTCEKYSIKENKWYSMPTLLSEERQTPTLFIKGPWLYAFFGAKQGENLNSVERINLKSPKSKWERVFYKNIEGLDLGLINTAIYGDESSESIMFVGGKSSKGVLSTIITFDFLDNSFKSAESELEDSAYFDESIFIKLLDNECILLNKEKGQLIKLSL